MRQSSKKLPLTYFQIAVQIANRDMRVKGQQVKVIAMMMSEIGQIKISSEATKWSMKAKVAIIIYFI